MLVPIAIGMYVAATCADIASVGTGDPFWARATGWLLLGTLMSATIAAIPGIIEFMSIERVQTLPVAWAHATGNFLFLMTAAGNYGLRQANPDTSHGGSGLVVTLLGLVLLIVSGWLGGEMSYRHGIGVARTLAAKPGPQGDTAPSRSVGNPSRQFLGG